MSLHRLRQRNAPVQELIKEHGLEAVLDELDEMTTHDMANLALECAIQITDSAAARRIASYAASVVLNSGSYSQESRETARKFKESSSG